MNEEHCPHQRRAQDQSQVEVLVCGGKPALHELYGKLHESGEKIIPIVLPTGIEGWLVTGYEEAKALFKDDRLAKDFRHANENWHATFSNRNNGTARPIFRHLINIDPPKHTELRALVQEEFNVTWVEQIRPHIEATADRLLDDMSEQDSVDLIEDYALPLPLNTICTILGVPEKDEAMLDQWVTTLLSVHAKDRNLIRQASEEIYNYLTELTQDQSPRARNALFGAFVRRQRHGDLSFDDLIAIGGLFLMAGYETVAGLIGNGLLAMLLNREAWQALCEQRHGVVKEIIREALRFESPVEAAPQRFATADMVIAGTQIKKGDVVFLSIAAANRDPNYFRDPNQFEVSRSSRPAHLSFGSGIHACLGAALAQLEGEVAFLKLASRFPDMELAVPSEELRWRPGFTQRPLESLRVRIR